MAMYNRVVSVITKPPCDRTESEITPLLPWFSKKSKLFENMKAEIMVDILRNCAFQVRYIDSVIIRQGERGDCFYIILSGRVSVYINTDVVPDDPNELPAVEATQGQNSDGPKPRLDRAKFGNFIAAFTDGKSFGELALITKDCIRNASIIADERTDLVVIDRDLFDRCLRAAQEADWKARQDFVNSCALFNGWMPRYKRQAVMSLRKDVLQFDSPIVKQGEPLDGLYFIIRGQARVVVDILMHVQQYPHLRLSDELLDEEQLRADAEAHQAVLRELQQHMRPAGGEDSEDDSAQESYKHVLWDRPVRRQGYVAAEQRLAKRNIEVSLITAGEIIGSIEQAMELGTYAHTMICTQLTEVFVLDAKNYERLVQKRNPRTMAMIRKNAETKLFSPVAALSVYRHIPLIHTLINCVKKEYRRKMKSRRSPRSPDGEDELQRPRSAKIFDFIPQRGPIIDEFGPGTIYYRNKQMREAREKQERHNFAGTPERRSSRLSSRSASKKHYMQKAHSHLSETYYHRQRTAEAQFEDWETSGKHLGELEQKMANWHSFVEELERERDRMSQRQLAVATPLSTARSVTQSERLEKDRPSIVPLRRLKVEKASQIKPGAKVVLRKRSPSFGASDSDSDSDHDSVVDIIRGKAVGRPRSTVNIRTDTPPLVVMQAVAPHGSHGSKQKHVKEMNKSQKQHSLAEYKELKVKLKLKEKELVMFRNTVF